VSFCCGQGGSGLKLRNRASLAADARPDMVLPHVELGKQFDVGAAWNPLRHPVVQRVVPCRDGDTVQDVLAVHVAGEFDSDALAVVQEFGILDVAAAQPAVVDGGAGLDVKAVQLRGEGDDAVVGDVRDGCSCRLNP
jgi:hypothetical protein